MEKAGQMAYGGDRRDRRAWAARGLVRFGDPPVVGRWGVCRKLSLLPTGRPERESRLEARPGRFRIGQAPIV
ncbi:hypothetical protein GCM10009533_42300 [Saccharopolyspora spinosporotrichia]|uniref:Uncharacterized protein n=1 Tax=Saccharopolyspora erythraea TaxID=1836 RepID=A0ABN1DAK5_SACER